MIYIGVDPGKSGGYAIIDTIRDTVNAFAWDDHCFTNDMKFMNSAYETQNEIRCCLEKVGAMPGNGSVSMFRFGQSFGFIIGVLTAFEIPFQLVPPRVWKKEFSLDNDKKKSIETAQRLFPDVNFLPTDRSRKPSDGMCEAVLLCEYARRKL